MYGDGGPGVEGDKVLLNFSEEVQQNEGGGGHTYLRPGQVVEMPHLTSAARLPGWEELMVHLLIGHR